MQPMPETPKNPPRPSNPYTNAQHSTPRHPNSNNTNHHQQNKQQNLTSWLQTAQTLPADNPNFSPATIPKHNQRKNILHRRRNQQKSHRPTQASPSTSQEQPESSQQGSQITQQTLPNNTGIQTIISPPSDNDHWGDPLHPLPPNSFRILSKNVNSLPTTDNFVQWRAAAAAGQTTCASVMCFQETNLRWDHNNHTRVAQIMRKSYDAVKISVSSSDEPSAPEYQPGGTFIATLGPWTSRVQHAANDSTGLGRWSYLTLRLKNDRKLQILSGYRVCEQNPTLGSRTCYNQQLRLLTAAGHHDPNPRKQFFLDLTQLVKTWRAHDNEIILCLDLNEDTSILNPLEDLGFLLSQTDLVDLHRHRHPTKHTPATHQRGSLTIDAILGSPQVAEAVLGAFYLPHGEPITLTGDHRTLGIDLEATVLFGTRLPTSLLTFHHGVNSNAYPVVPEFCKEVVRQCDELHLFDRLDNLLLQHKFQPHHHTELEEIDEQLTQILVHTDQKFRKRNNLPWSPILHTAYLTHRYWMLCLTQKRTE